MRVEPLQIPQQIAAQTPLGRAADTQPPSFAGYLESAMAAVESLSKKASDLQAAFARGGVTDVHQVTIAAQEAEIALELVLAIRNKVIEAYQEIMRMTV
jgi:flagellar hook-basal body complex protein FliE